ncbi:MAG: thioredoxin family protein [Acidobacteria bacterium]|nr:thioredoxin family protein [Acidobacteriota bacterium]
MHRTIQRPSIILTLALGIALGGHALAAQGGPAPMHPMPTASDATMKNDFRPFTPAAFKATQDAGGLSLVFFHAPWCPVCRAQEPKLMSRLNGMYTDIVPFKVDYDSNQSLRGQMNVTRQSTVIVYRGAKEIARLSYTSDDAAIDELFGKTTQAGMGGM